MAESSFKARLKNLLVYQRKHWNLGFNILLFTLGVIFVIYWLLVGQYYETTNDSYVSGNLVQIMPGTSGFVTSILAVENDLVHIGQPLVTLDRTEAENTLKKAEATLASTAKQVQQPFTDLNQNPILKESIERFRHAYLALSHTIILAPANGYITKQSIKIGQPVTPDSAIMTILPFEQMWVDANFKKSKLQDLRIDQIVSMTSDIYGSTVKYLGKVVGISDLEISPRNETGSWIRKIQRVPVRIKLDVEQLAKHPLKIGAPMSVAVDKHQINGENLSKISNSKMLYQTIDYESEIKNANKLINEIVRAGTNNDNFNIEAEKAVDQK